MGGIMSGIPGSPCPRCGAQMLRKATRSQGEFEKCPFCMREVKA